MVTLFAMYDQWNIYSSFNLYIDMSSEVMRTTDTEYLSRIGGSGQSEVPFRSTKPIT